MISNNFLCRIKTSEVRDFLMDSVTYSTLHYFKRRFPEKTFGLEVEKAKSQQNEPIFVANYMVKETGEVWQREELGEFSTLSGREYDEKTGKLSDYDKRWFNFVNDHALGLENSEHENYKQALINHHAMQMAKKIATRISDIESTFEKDIYKVK